MLEESLEIARSLRSPKKIGGVLQLLGMAALGEGDRPLARRCLTEALAIARVVGESRGIATAANDLGQLYRLEGLPAEATALFEESIGMSRANGDRDTVAIGLLNLAMVSMRREAGRFARGCVAEALETSQALHSQPLMKSALEAAAGLAALAGDDRAAVRFYGAAEAQAVRTGLRRDPADAAFLAPLIEAATKRLGLPAFTDLESEGRSLPVSQAAAEAREWLGTATETSTPICR